MLNFFSRHRLIIVVMGFFLIFAIAVAISFFVPIYGEYCGKNEYTNAKECATYHIALTFFWQIIKATNDYGSALTALATIAVACFTGTLWWAAAGQYDLLADQIDLARQEFTASHRPEMKIHSLRVWPLEDNIAPEKQPLIVEFIIINAGTGAATVTESAVYLEYRPDRPFIPDLIKNDIIRPRHYPVADSLRILAPSDRDGRALHTQRPEGWFLSLSGWLRYDDGTGKARSTFFCRKFDSALNRSTPVDDPECNCTY